MAKVTTRISRSAKPSLSLEEKLKLFDAATRRQAVRNRKGSPRLASAARGWTREELYDRE